MTGQIMGVFYWPFLLSNIFSVAQFDWSISHHVVKVTQRKWLVEYAQCKQYLLININDECNIKKNAFPVNTAVIENDRFLF